MRAALVVGAALAVLAGAPVGLRGQDDVVRLAGECGADVAGLRASCREAVLAVQAAQGALGLAATGGATLPGSASTLGRRFGGMPRLALSGRVGFSHQGMPRPDPSAQGPSPEETFFVTAAQADVVAGLFDGFSAAPTVGGILSVDVLGSVTLLSPPDARGFDGSAVAWGAGARLGVFRESFSLPGVTLSATRRWTGDEVLGALEEDGYEAEFDVTVTSLRGTVSKDFIGLGILAGLGWDRYESEATVAARWAPSGGPERLGRVTDGDLTTERLLFFGGITYTYLVAQVSAEGGFAGGYDDIPGRTPGGYDPTEGAVFVRLGVRLTL